MFSYFRQNKILKERLVNDAHKYAVALSRLRAELDYMYEQRTKAKLYFSDKQKRLNTKINKLEKEVADLKRELNQYRNEISHEPFIFNDHGGMIRKN